MDPRECAPDDAFANLTASDEEPDIQRELQDIERKRQDLLMRLEANKNRSGKDPNLRKTVQVPGSPDRRKAQKLVERHDLEAEKSTFADVNANELSVRSKIAPTPSPSYFVQRMQEAKRLEKKKIDKHVDMISKRIHTFPGQKSHTIIKPFAVNEIDLFSNLNLSRRYLSHEDLEAMLQDIKLLRLPKLFAKVKPPRFHEPDYANWCTIGIISKKNEIKYTAAEKPKKYFTFILTDFHHQLTVYVFGNPAVQRYYNLKVGDIIAILNPQVLPWRPNGKQMNIKAFNLSISHNFDCILEIGTSRDLGFCGVTNRSTNSACGTPINKSKQQCCEYHREIQMRSNHSKRIELSGSYALGAPTKVGSRPDLYRQSGNRETSRPAQTTFYQANQIRDADTASRDYRFSSSKSAQAFFDEKYQDPDLLANLDSKRRKLQDAKRETKLNKVLMRAIGNSQDAESKNYLNVMKNQDKDELRATSEQIVQNGIMQGIGFDPTHGQVTQVLKALQRKRGGDLMTKPDAKTLAINDLKGLRKRNVTLPASKDELRRRKLNRQRVWERHFKQDYALHSDHTHTPGIPVSGPPIAKTSQDEKKNTTTACRITEQSHSSDESDLEITMS